MKIIIVICKFKIKLHERLIQHSYCIDVGHSVKCYQEKLHNQIYGLIDN